MDRFCFPQQRFIMKTQWPDTTVTAGKLPTALGRLEMSWRRGTGAFPAESISAAEGNPNHFPSRQPSS